jgi:hypothetical protein
MEQNGDVLYESIIATCIFLDGLKNVANYTVITTDSLASKGA